MTTQKDYVLGTDAEELSRLGFQSRLWSDEAVTGWKNAGFRLGHTILDVGCGPGFGSRDLAGFLGPKGKVIAIDQSRTYLDFVESAERGAHLAPIQTIEADIHTMDLPANSADGAYSRWVLCFVTDPEAVVARVARALKPGASFCVQDYANYRALTWGPARTMNIKVMEAVAKSWEERGGDSNVGLRLPSMMARHGLEVTGVRSLAKACRPGDALWQWPDTYFKIFLPKLVATGHLTEADARAWHSEWEALSNDPNSVFLTPTYIEVIARKLK